MTSSPIRTEWHGDVLEVRLNRPERRNAMNDAMVDALFGAITQEAQAARCLVLTGDSSFFSAGGEIGTMGTADDGTFGPARRLTRIHGVLGALRDLECPSICAVEGYAIGAGWGLALGTDVLICAGDAWFSAPFAARGLAADAGVAWHLNRRLGRHGSARHLLLGERLSAHEAHGAGLVTQLCAPGEARAVALECASTIASSAIQSMAITRWMGHDAEAKDLLGYLRDERIGVNLAGHGQEAKEGRAAFTEKREAVFGQ